MLTRFDLGTDAGALAAIGFVLDRARGLWDIHRMKRRGRKAGFDPGRRMLERERCRLVGYQSHGPVRDAVGIGSVLEEVLKGLGLEEQQWFSELDAEWASLVGGPVAQHTRPGRLDRGCLVVFVDSSVWLSELSRYRRREMLSALRDRFGRQRIDEIVLRLDPGAAGGR